MNDEAYASLYVSESIGINSNDVLSRRQKMASIKMRISAKGSVMAMLSIKMLHLVFFFISEFIFMSAEADCTQIK